MTKRWVVSVGAGWLVLAALSAGTASAEPTTAAPPPPATSTPDELADMVMDAMGHGASAPSTTAVPAPPH